jgi:hypothetical protein
MAAYHLIVHNPFGAYPKGAHIRDVAEVERILAGPNRANVHRIAPVGEPVSPPTPVTETPA